MYETEDELGGEVSTLELLVILALVAWVTLVDAFEWLAAWPFENEQLVTRWLVGVCIAGVTFVFVDNFGRYAHWWGR